MTPRVLIISDSQHFRLFVELYVLKEWHDAKVNTWNPMEKPGSRPEIKLGDYDVIVADPGLGSGAGVELLNKLRLDPKCPPMIFLIDAATGQGALNALKLWATDYLSTQDITREKLTAAITAALAGRACARPERAAPDGAVPSDDGLAIIDGDKSIRTEGYRFINKIGAGGLSSVYLAERTKDRLLVALKILHADITHSDQSLERFIREYGIISGLTSPYVVKIYEQGFFDEQVYIAMEYIPGDDLMHFMLMGLAPQQALSVIYQAGKALHAIHSVGVIHRDLKPQNVMFREDGSLVLVDFGLSKRLGDDDGLTRHGQVLGTPLYMSPEQCQGNPADHRSDLYSLGVMAYEMLAGRRLFRADPGWAVVEMHINEPVPRLPPELQQYQEFLDRLLAKRPDERFQSAQEMLDYITGKWGTPDAAPSGNPKSTHEN